MNIQPTPDLRAAEDAVDLALRTRGRKSGEYFQAVLVLQRALGASHSEGTAAPKRRPRPTPQR